MLFYVLFSHSFNFKWAKAKPYIPTPKNKQLGEQISALAWKLQPETQFNSVLKYVEKKNIFFKKEGCLLK